MAICTTKTGILSGGEQVLLPVVERRVQGGPGVGHGQAVVRVGHGAQTFLQLVALSALRTGPPDRFRGAAAADATPDDAAAAAPAADEKYSAASAPAGDSHAAASAAVRRRRPEREVTGRRRFGDRSR